jgi:hypothetical protein
MFFVKHPSLTPDLVPPPTAKPRLIKLLKDNWLFALGAGSLGLVVLCGLW